MGIQNDSISLYLSVQVFGLIQFFTLITSIILNCGGKSKNPTTQPKTTTKATQKTEGKSIVTQVTQNPATTIKTLPKTESTEHEQVEAKSVEDEKKDTTAGTGGIATSGEEENVDEKVKEKEEPKSIGAPQPTTRSEAAAYSQVVHQMPSLALGTENIPEQSMIIATGNDIMGGSPLSDLGKQPSLCLMTESFAVPATFKNAKKPTPPLPTKPEPPKIDPSKKETELNKPSAKQPAKTKENEKKPQQDNKKPTNQAEKQFMKKSDPNYNQYATLALVDDIQDDAAKSVGLKK